MDSANTFVLFGQAHWATLLLIAAVSAGLPLWAHRTLAHKAQYRLGAGIAALLIGQEILDVGLRALYGWPWSELLPLHLCGLAVFLTAWVLIGRSYRVYEVVYFWAWGGTLQALLTPDLAVGFPAPEYLAFFAGHGLVILGILYATLVYRYRPWPKSILRSLVALLAVAAVVAPINLWLDTNYLFLSEKPSQASLMDYLGPWPWYILGLAALGVFSCLLYYSPFFIRDVFVRHSQKAA